MMKQKKGLTTYRYSGLKEAWSWATVGQAAANHQAPTHRLKLYVRAVIES